MAHSATFKKTLAVVIAVAGVTFALALTLGHFIAVGAPLSPKNSAVRHVSAPDGPVTALPSKPAQALPTGDPMIVTVRAAISSEDGPVVAIGVKPTAEPCTEPKWLDARDVHLSKPAAPLKLKSEASWCLRLMPGQKFDPLTLEGRWMTLADRTLALDAAHQYMRVQHSSGRWLGIRAIAAGYCASETSTCSGTTLVEVSADDQNLIVPMIMSSRSREVLRLTRADEIVRSAWHNANGHSEPDEDDDIEAEVVTTPAQTEPTTADSADPDDPAPTTTPAQQ